MLFVKNRDDFQLPRQVKRSSQWGMSLLAASIFSAAAWLIQGLVSGDHAVAGKALVAEENRQAPDDPASGDSSPGFSPEDLAFYRERIEPILVKNCNECHGAGSKFRGGFSLAAREHLLKGGESGPGVLLDKPDESMLIDVINYRTYEMPPSGKLPADQIASITEWVKRGAPMPPPAVPVAMPVHEGPPQVNETTKAHWAFRPVTDPRPPVSQLDRLAKNDIDRFLFAKMEAAGLEPVGPAEKRTLIRRLYYDVIGLPPSPAQVEAFVQDASPEAISKVIDDLLESPHYGEKWGRFWLDLVRYAETNSFERDNPKPNAWKYRDYVIDSFNRDKPYDQFLIEQLAGDELPQVTRDSVIATGYYRLNAWDDEPADQRQAFYDEMDDIVSTTGQVMLGMTIGCARCHDHKLDPMPQKDYYGFLAFMADLQSYAGRGDQMNSRWSQTDISSPEVIQAHAERDAAVQKLEEEMRQIEQGAILKMKGEDQRKTEGAERKKVLREKLKDFLSKEELDHYQGLKNQLEELRKRALPPREMVLSVNNCQMPPRVTPLLIRGNPATPGEPVEPRFLSVLTDDAPQLPTLTPGQKTAGRRLVLANWIASKENPLTARVMVNRIWQMHFGRGLVKSSSNFGLKGDLPTHPELLDWLTTRFIEGGFRIKPLHRLILQSYAWQMSSRPTAAQLNVDPQNDLYSHFDMRRLTAEETRDGLLAVSGELNLAVGGPSVYTAMPKEVLAGQSVPGQGWGQSSPEEQNRRSVYIHVKRSLLVPTLSSLDFPDPDGTCPIRFATTQPTQALTSLNSAFYNQQAKEFAERVRADLQINELNDESLRQCVAQALTLTTNRPPTTAEVERGFGLIQSLRDRGQVSAELALERFCLVAINLNEFLYLD